MTTESITEEEILSQRVPPLFKGNIGNKDMGGPSTILDALRLDICENVDQSHFEKKISFPCGLFFKNETMARSDPREGWGAKFRIAHQDITPMLMSLFLGKYGERLAPMEN